MISSKCLWTILRNVFLSCGRNGHIQIAFCTKLFSSCAHSRPQGYLHNNRFYNFFQAAVEILICSVADCFCNLLFGFKVTNSGTTSFSFAVSIALDFSISLVDKSDVDVQVFFYHHLWSTPYKNLKKKAQSLLGFNSLGYYSDDLIRAESILLKSHWVMVIMDHKLGEL